MKMLSEIMQKQHNQKIKVPSGFFYLCSNLLLYWNPNVWELIGSTRPFFLYFLAFLHCCLLYFSSLVFCSSSFCSSGHLAHYSHLFLEGSPSLTFTAGFSLVLGLSSIASNSRSSGSSALLPYHRPSILLCMVNRGKKFCLSFHTPKLSTFVSKAAPVSTCYQ